MYIRSGHYIRCDFCLQVGSGPLNQDNSMAERGTKLRRVLRKKGWRRTKGCAGWFDHCPDCAKKRIPKDAV